MKMKTNPAATEGKKKVQRTPILPTKDNIALARREERFHRSEKRERWGGGLSARADAFIPQEARDPQDANDGLGGGGRLGGKGFDRGRSAFYTGGMEVKLSPELQAKLDNMAAQQGRDSASLVHEAVERLIGYDEWFVRQVEAGLAQIERGEVLEHGEVAARMEKLIAEKQRRS
jgi:predicted transcriptional regulator